MKEEIKLYTVKEIADILQVTTRTIYSHISTGKIKASKVGRKFYIKEQELKRLLENE